MTVPVPCPGAIVDVSAAAPRKRRRRAPASGAADDCFACSKSHTKCDRRRPYCSQCLEFGTECSGYKTQLTWGVGVASRGKLRGLSLPIARSAPAPRSPSMKPARTSSTTASSTTSATTRPRAAVVGGISRARREEASGGGGGGVKLEGQSPLPPASPYTTYDFVNMVPNSPMGMHLPAALGGADWASMSMSPPDYLRLSHSSTPEPGPPPPLLRHSLQRLHTPLLTHGGSGSDEMALSSSGSISGYSDAEYSPLEHSFSADDVAYLASPMPMYHAYSGQNSPVDHSFGLLADPRGPTSCPEHYYAQSELSSSLSSHPAIYDLHDHHHHTALGGSPALRERDLLYGDEAAALSTSHDGEHFLGGGAVWGAARHHHEDYQHHHDHHDHHQQQQAWAATGDGVFRLPSPEAFQLPPVPDAPPRLSVWLNYYDKIICPITVAIDGPSNPYRRHILHLARESPSLQHAICALASCNLRMKRRQQQPPPPQAPTSGRLGWTSPLEWEMTDRLGGLGGGGGGSGFQLLSHVRSAPAAAAAEFPAAEGPDDELALQEEYRNRGQAVQLLNQQLSDPARARHDSVLATLLILCHYRMCESGVAQFQTQFAGVKKLLGMRASGVETGKWGWMETLFTFFDAIAATVNDREAQLRGGYLEMIANPSAPDAALDNLAGFDGRLFKIVATLGRLNLLSQHRPVLDPLRPRSAAAAAAATFAHRPTPSPAHPRLAGQALVDYYKTHGTRFDGNGFTSTLDADLDAEPFPAYVSSSASASSPGAEPAPGDDARPLFWAEWTTTRSLLQTWEFSPSSLAAALPGPSDPGLTRDFAYVSEAFRYAALLYIERLACPTLPSGHLNFQNLVAQVLFFVEALGQGQGRDQSLGGGSSSSSREGSTLERFLLWPLFVAGSECVSDLHRDTVRARCRSLVSRSGYGNNLAALEVLEQIWKDPGVDGGARDGSGPQEPSGRPGGGGVGASPFRWTNFIAGAEGEYIMV